MSLYSRLAGSQLGSAAIFGGAFFLAYAAIGLADAATAGALAGGSWFASVPLLRRLIGATAGA
jgi:hypothetical protein